jgi:hypothetical protein
VHVRAQMRLIARKRKEEAEMADKCTMAGLPSSRSRAAAAVRGAAAAASSARAGGARGAGASARGADGAAAGARAVRGGGSLMRGVSYDAARGGGERWA